VPARPGGTTPPIRFLFVAPRFWIGLPSDPPHDDALALFLPSARRKPGVGAFTPQVLCHARHTRRNQRWLEAIRWIVLCTPGMGVNLWGESPLYMNPVNGDTVSISTSRRQGRRREAVSEGSRSAKATSRRIEMAYKAQSPGKLAQHNEAQGSGDRVNAAVV